MMHLPRSVSFGGAEFPIRTDYREIIQLESILFKTGVEETQRVMDALRYFYTALVPADTNYAVDSMLDFYRCDQPIRPPMPGQSHRRAFYYAQDAPLVYAAFLGQYDMDLIDIDYLHWYKFRALFEGLSPDTQLCRIMGYRTADISKMSGETQRMYRDLRRHYALPEEGISQEKISEIEQALLMGSGVSELL